jgi:hypothetical protein
MKNLMKDLKANRSHVLTIVLNLDPEADLLADLQVLVEVAVNQFQEAVAVMRGKANRLI